MLRVSHGMYDFPQQWIVFPNNDSEKNYWSWRPTQNETGHPNPGYAPLWTWFMALSDKKV